jgi:tetratricopeptide (TPR) repeat protein
MLKATKLHEQGKIREAKLAYEDFLIQNPDNAQAIHLLGIACYQLGELDRAYTLISHAINLQPDNAAFYCNRGLVLQQLGRPSEALTDYQQSAFLDSENAATHNNQGNALQDLHRYEDAISCYEKAITLNPQYPEALNNLGNALRAARKAESAITYFQRAIKLNPNYAEAYSNLGVALYDLSRFDEAITCYQKAIDINPNYAEAISNQGNAFSRLHKYGEALALYQRVVEFKPGSAKAYLNRADALEKLDRLDDAIASYQAAINIGPLDAEALFNLGFVQARMGDLDLAVQSLKQALEIKMGRPKDSDFISTPPADTNNNDNEVHLWRMLVALANAGIRAFPCSGTLLGLIRDGKLISWDKDIDIGVPFDHFQAAVDCLTTHQWTPRPNNLRIINKRGFNHANTAAVIDLTGFKESPEGKETIGGFWQEGQRSDWQRIATYPPMLLEQVKRPEGTVWMLSNPESWLEATYGNWNEPIQQWDSVVAARNLKGFSLLAKYYALMRVWIYWDEGILGKAKAVADCCLDKEPDCVFFATLAKYLEVKH